jgi:1-acyl-sn-glycerol-3-phosphate acyltransferase
MDKFSASAGRALIYAVHNFYKMLSWLYLHIFHFYRAYNVENIPSKGGFVAASNHASFLDPPLIGIATFRRIFRYMARDTLFKLPVWGWMLEKMGAIPLKRGVVNRDAWDKVINCLKQGWIVGMFPEGTRTPDGEMKEGRAGVGMMVYKAGCGVIPVYIHNSYAAWPKGRALPRVFTPVEVVYGVPMTFAEQFAKPESKEVYQEITDRIMAEIRKLRDNFAAMKAARGK